MSGRDGGHWIARAVARAGSAALTAGAVIGACCLLLTVAGLLFDVRPLIFRSGSMTPAIPAGSLAVARQVPVSSVRVGDIVSVPYRDVRVTHRVVEVSTGPGGTELWLQGDASDRRDPEPYRVQTADRVLFSVPVLGQLVGWLSRPPGVFVLAGYAAVLLAVLFGRRRSTRDDPDGSDPTRMPLDRSSESRPAPWQDTAARRNTHRRLRAAFGAVLLGGTAGLIAAPSWATFTDTVPVSGTSIGTHRIPAPTLSCGVLGVLSVTLRWTAVPGATSYTLYYGANGSQSITTTNLSYTHITAVRLSGRAWVTANRDFGSTTWTSANSNQATYIAAVVGLCST